MTIQEAIKSGKPFRRPFYARWYFVAPSGIIFVDHSQDLVGDRSPQFPTFSDEGILAEDWEIKQ